MHILFIPQINKHYNCMDFYCRSISDLANRDYQCIFMKQWDFDFNQEADSIGKGIHFYNRNHSITDEKNYKLMFHHGIVIKYHYTSSSDEVMQNLYTYLQYNRPLLVRFDGNMLDWGNEIEKTIRRYKQMFLVVGINNSHVFYYDTHNPSSERKMDINLFKRGCILNYKDKPFKTIYSTYEVYDDPSRNYKLDNILKQSLETTSESLFSSSKFEAMRSLAKKIKSDFSLSNEIIDNLPIELSPLMERLTLITGSRSRYEVFIKYLYYKYKNEDLREISKQFSELSTQWYEIWCLFMKSMYMNNIGHKDKIIIADKIMHISDKEERLYLQLKQMCL